MKISGLFFFLAGTIILLGILTAEIFYPVRYSISQNMISNLGATPPPDSMTHQPSASIFDYSLIISGILILLGTILMQKVYRKNFFTVSLVCMGIGTAGVGIFPAFNAMVHPLVALLAFLSGGVCAVVSYNRTKLPFSFLALVLGIISLSCLFLGIVFPLTIVSLMGKGGAERWVLYPLVIWLIGFGGYLMNVSISKK